MAQTTFGSQGPSGFSTMRQTSFSQAAPSYAPEAQGSALSGPTRFSGTAGIEKTQVARHGMAQPKYSREFGMRITPEQKAELQKAEADFNNRVAKYQSEVANKIGSAKSQLQAEEGDFRSKVAQAQAELATAKGQVQQGWRELDKAQPNIMNMFNQWYNDTKTAVTVEGQGRYFLPKEAVNNLMRNKDIQGSWDPKKNLYTLSARQGGRMQGQELHDALREASDKRRLLSQFAAHPEVQQARAAAEQQLAVAARQLTQAERQLNKVAGQVKQGEAQGEQQIRGAKFDIEEGEKEGQREVKRAKTLAEGQREARKEQYDKWRQQRMQAYRVLAQMGVQDGQR